MAVFWLLATLMTALALAFLLIPLLRARAGAGPSARDANLAVLRGQRREIEADVENGILPASERDEALAELVERARGDLAGPAESEARSSRPWIAAAIAGFALPAVAFGLYLVFGAPGALEPRAPVHGAGKLDDQQIEAMVENLARKVRERPDDIQGWSLLARSMGALGRFDEAAAAYEHLAKLVPDDAQVLADYADALGMAQGRTLAGRPTELVKKALAIDPRNRKALALAGTAAMDTGDFEASARYWQLLAAQTAPDSDDAKQVQAILDEVKDKAAAAGKPLPPSATRVVVAAPAAPSGALTGSVSIAPDLEKKIAASDTLFVFARAENGSRMPLAVVRSSAKSLPMTFALDDSMAMSPNARLSGASAVRVEARVSRSGTATPQSGDFIGTSEVVKPNARDVKIVIDKTVP